MNYYFKIIFQRTANFVCGKYTFVANSYNIHFMYKYKIFRYFQNINRNINRNAIQVYRVRFYMHTKFSNNWILLRNRPTIFNLQSATETTKIISIILLIIILAFCDGSLVSKTAKIKFTATVT